MCIIVYKPAGIKFPTKQTLKTCFEHNPDGAGFMYALGGEVHIEKGLMSFTKFYNALKTARKKAGEDAPFVMHFRISTQAGTRADCTHPYPLSQNMEDLRKLSTTAKIGVAHNGVISLTSENYYYSNYYYYSSAKNSVTYNDTMKFITDYLSLIIKDKNFYKDEDTILLIKRLCESRLAILDSDGHCQLIGNGWILDNDVIYSNSSYEQTKITAKETNKEEKETPKTETKITVYSSDDDDEDDYMCSEYCPKYAGEDDDGYCDCMSCANYKYCFNCADDDDEYDYDEGKFNFEPSTCPVEEDEDFSYCKYCSQFDKCFPREDDLKHLLKTNY